ncbi:hypothetical protein [Cupriavidus sp. UGS-1]|uniref:hypothetical protein n=1 Tax=Cupriavidus sp. UGS-1 TaxID=2899826 RepID=UPI001E481795|nr:hypothetical protein [Cupriavidus sp. UGS-1]MCD9120666.1 hypothetical protein [Cupriavidus sp. UGS-1]
MSTIEPVLPAVGFGIPVPRDATSAEASTDSPDTVSATASNSRSENGARQNSVNGVNVRISGPGQSLAQRSAAASGNQDIEESGLPETIQDLLKRIRELRKQLQEKQQELQALMADQSMTPQQRQLRQQALQSELASINGALTEALGMLNRTLRESKTPPEQMQKAATLAML